MTGAQGLTIFDASLTNPDASLCWVPREAAGRASSCTAALHQGDPAHPLAPQSRGGMWRYSKARLQDPTLHTCLGGKRNFSAQVPRSVLADAPPSARRVFGAAHGAALAPLRQGSKLLGPGAIHGLCNMPPSHGMGSLQTSDFMHGFPLRHCSI